MKLVLQSNDLVGGKYAEPFAGGAGVAIGLLLTDYVSEIIINDVDVSIHAFWASVLNDTERICEMIRTTPLDMDEYRSQKEIYRSRDSKDLTELGFAFFYLNRTNRSGILNGGVIGGNDQTGNWKIDARFPRKSLIDKITAISERKDQIRLFNLDARRLIKDHLSEPCSNRLTYIDPPYYHKGKELYLNSYRPDDHVLISHSIKTSIKSPWIISYDNTPEICDLYREFRQETFSLNYTAANRYHGSEVIIYSDSLTIPLVENPFVIDAIKLKKYRLQLSEPENFL